MSSQRQLRVGEEIRHVLAALFMRGEFVWPEEFGGPNMTVTEVKISPDLKNATVFVMPLGGGHAKEIVRFMNEHLGFFRHAVAQEISLRYTPRIHFEADLSFEYAHHIDRILHDPAVARDLNDLSDPDEA